MALKVLNFDTQKVPTFKEARGKDWILFGDEGDYKNRYPEYLLDLYRRSAKNHAIINSKKEARLLTTCSSSKATTRRT